MSAVYLARDLRFTVKKTIAIKEMNNRTTDDMSQSKAVKIFEREANILASLNHLSVPQIYDFFTLGSRSYLVMEHVYGDTLESIINKSEDFLPQSQVCRWAIELCDVLCYLHNHKPQPIIFRDMKPANIMITPDNHVILVDFGIAKAFQVGKKGTMVGTEGYSPPEQYRGEGTPSVDIYALGATLHHALTKKDPRVEAPFTFSERSIRKINPDVSIDLESIVNTALQYNASDRYNNIAEMRDALLAITQNNSHLKSNRTSFINTSTSIKPLWVFECEDEIRGTPAYHDGVIYIGAYDNNLYALDASTGEFIWKYPTDGGIVTKPAIYDDKIFIGSIDNRLHVVSPHSGRVIWTYFADGPIHSSPQISDRHVFFGADDSNLHIVNASIGRRATKVDLGAPIRSTPLIHNEIVYLGTESGDFFAIDYRGRMKWRARAKRAITSSPTVADDVVYFGSLDGYIYAMDAITGWGIWRYRMKKGTISSPFVHENHVYVGSADGNIYAVNGQLNKASWLFKTDHQVSGSPILYNDGVYCGSVDGNLYCLDRETGQLRWKFPTGGGITGSPIAQNGILYFGSLDHKLYAVPS